MGWSAQPNSRSVIFKRCQSCCANGFGSSGCAARAEASRETKGYRVIDTDNGQDAARQARQTHPDLLVVDMDVPLLYGLVAARQIIKHAHVGPMPVVIVSHEDVVDPAPMMEVGATRNEYVTRFSHYQELQYLLDYLLPVLPPTDGDDPGEESFPTRRETSGLPLLAASAPELRLRPDTARYKPESATN